MSRPSNDPSPRPSSVSALWNHKGLWLLQVAANAALIVLVYEWLWIPDRTVTHLVISALTGAAILGLALLLYGGTLSFFRALHSGNSPSWAAAFGFSVNRLGAFALWAMILVAAMTFAFWVGGYQERLSNWLSSFLTLQLRRPVTPASVGWLFSWVITITAFIVLPALLLPSGSQAAYEGFRGLSWSGIKKSFHLPKRFRYWVAYVALFVVGAVVPYLLVWWIPVAGGFYGETASLAVRFLLAYLLAITAWLLLASMVGRGTSSST